MAPRPFLPIFLSLLLSSSLTSSLSPPTTIAISPTKPPSTPSPTKSPSAPSPTTSPPSSSSPSSSSSSLDPKQLRALQSLNIPTSKDPCTSQLCDSSKPFRHLLSLILTNCSDDVQISITALKSLSTLTTLEFLNCPTTSAPLHLPSDLASNLRSFTAINSLRRLTGVWLSHLQNLTDLTISAVTINASGPSIILSPMKKLKSVTISQSNLTGFLPKHFHLNLTHIDLSNNRLRGKLPISLTRLESLQLLNLSSNALNGEIPNSIGDLLALQNLSLSSNSLSGSIPESMAAIPSLIHLDLGSNQLNGTIPKFIADMKSLKYLNLENNNFTGVMPFNASFIKRLVLFKIGSNTNLCYNHSTISPKVKLGIAPCDKHGLPLSPPPAKDSSGSGGQSSDGGSVDDDYSDGGDESGNKKKHTNGPSKVVLGVAIGLSSVVFLIIFCVLISKCCR